MQLTITLPDMLPDQVTRVMTKVREVFAQEGIPVEIKPYTLKRGSCDRIKRNTSFSFSEILHLSIIIFLPFFLAILLTLFFFDVIGSNANNRFLFDPTNLAQLGEYFGGLLNPVIAYIGLSGIFYTLIHNKNILNNTIQGDEETKKKHIEIIAQSNTATTFNAFDSAIKKARCNDAIISSTAIRNILLNAERPSSSEFLDATSQLFSQWGGAARCLSLLYLISRNATKTGDPFVYTAIAMLTDNEFSYILICLAQSEDKVAQEIMHISSNRLSPNIIYTINAISNKNI